MHGVIQPIGFDVPGSAESRLDRLRARVLRHRWFIGLVVVPTVIVAAYLYALASDQYQSEAHFLVHTAETQKVSSASSSVAAFFGGGSSVSPEAMSVGDFMRSHDAVVALQKNIGLTVRYRRDGVDTISKLRDHATDAALLRYYLAHTKVEFDDATGITTLTARAFTANDAYAIANELLRLGEQRINSLNAASYSDAVQSQQAQLSAAERQLRQAQGEISQFRASRRVLDPIGTGTAQTDMISSLTASLSQARAQLNSVGKALSHDSPQYVALQRQVSALEAQVADQQARLAGGGTTIASNVAGYNVLQLRQDFASKQFEAAAAALTDAQQQAIRKQLYLVRVVDANRPGSAEYPSRLRIIATVFASLMMAYGVGWLIVAGTREYAA